MDLWGIAIIAVAALACVSTWAYASIKRPNNTIEQPKSIPDEMVLAHEARLSSLELRQTNLENECQATLARANTRAQRAKKMVDSVEGKDLVFDDQPEPESDPDQLPMQLPQANSPVTLADVRAKARARRR